MRRCGPWLLLCAAACGDDTAIPADAGGVAVDGQPGAFDATALATARIRYVEGGLPVAGAVVFFSDFDGGLVDTVETDGAGSASVVTMAPLYATVLRAQVPTVTRPNPYPMALTVLVEPGQDLVMGSLVSEYDSTTAGFVRACWNSEPERTLWVTIESGVSPTGDNRNGDGGECLSDQIPVGAMGEPAVDVLVTAVSLDQVPHPYALVSGVDLTPLADGEPHVEVEVSAWSTNPATTDVTIRNLDFGSPEVSTDLYRGDRWYRLHRASLFNAGSTETLTISYPPLYGDSLLLRVLEWSQFESPGFRQIIRHHDGTPATSDVDMSTAPWWNGGFELIREDALVTEARWTDVVPPTADAVHVVLVPQDIQRWDILLPPGTTRFAFPGLPEPFAEWLNVHHRPIGLKIEQIDSSWVDGYESFVAAWTSEEVLRPQVGRETRIGGAEVRDPLSR